MHKPLLVLVSLFSLPLAAQWNDAWRPDLSAGYPNFCTITAVSTGSTARVTVSSSATCGAANLRKVWIGMVKTNHATDVSMNVNIGLANSTDSGGRARTLRTVGGQPNQWDIYDADNTNPVATTGQTYSSGGVMLPVELKPLNFNPRIMVPGPGSSLATLLSSTSAGGYYQSGRTMRTALDNAVANYVAVYGSLFGADPRMSHTGHCAMQWWALGRPGSGAARDCTLWGLTNIQQYLPSTACVEASATFGCIGGASEISDYRHALYMQSLADAWDFGETTLTNITDRQNALDWVWNDLPPIKGGHGYAGVTKTAAAFITTAGTVSYTGGTNVVNCSSGAGTCGFQTRLTVGGVLVLPGRLIDGYSGMYTIATIPTQDQLTLTKVIGYENGDGQSRTNIALEAAPAWTNANYGILWERKHHYYSPFAKNNIFANDSTYPNYGSNSGLYGGAADTGYGFWQNHTLAGLLSWTVLALSMADDDPRANVFFTDALCTWYVAHQRAAWASYTPITAEGAGYNPGRAIPQISALYGGLKNSFTDAPEFVPSTWWSNLARITLGHFIYLNNGTINNTFPYQNDNSWYELYGIAQPFVAGGWVNLAAPSLTWTGGTYSANVRHWLSNYLTGFTANSFFQSGSLSSMTTGNGGMQLIKAFVMDRPDITAVQSTNTTFSLDTTMKATCDATYGSSPCGSYFFAPRYAYFSYSGLTPGNSSMAYTPTSISYHDQYTQCEETQMTITVNQNVLYAGDGTQYWGCSGGGTNNGPRNSILSIGGLSNFTSYPLGIGLTVIERSYGTSSAMVTTVNLTGHYTAGADVATAYQTIVHAKGAGAGKDAIITRTDVVTNTSKESIQHHNLYTARYSGGANTAFSGCPASCSQVSLTPGASASVVYTPDADSRLIGKFGGGSTDTPTGSASGAYAGGVGLAYQLRQRQTGTNVKFVNVWRPATSNTETMADPTRGTSGTFETIHQPLADGTDILAGISNQTNATSFTMTTPAYVGNAQLVVVGLAIDTYRVQSGGVTVPTCSAIPVLATEFTLNCNAVPSGLVTVTSTTGILTNTTTTPLVNGMVGAAYSATATATGGTGGNVWDIPVGTLCGGLTLSAAGAFTGTPTTAQTCSFTLRVTDSSSSIDSKVVQITIDPAPLGTGGTLIRGNANAKGAVIKR